MTTVNMHQAKTNLSKLVERALAGEVIVLGRAGRPLVRLTPVVTQSPRVLGIWKGKGEIADDFDAPLPDALLDAFEGK